MRSAPRIVTPPRPKREPVQINWGEIIRPSIGFGAYSGLRLYDTTQSSSDAAYSNGDMFALANLNFNVKTYVDFAIGVRYGTATRLSSDYGSDTGNSWSLLGLDYALLGKYPFHITKQLSAFPVFGLGLTTYLSQKSNDDGTEWSRDALKDSDSWYFKFGGGVNHAFTKKLLFNALLMYDVFLHSEAVAKSGYGKYVQHGPNITVGVSYVF